jgi:hypothetical protein
MCHFLPLTSLLAHGLTTYLSIRVEFMTKTEINKSILIFECPVCKLTMPNPNELREHRLNNHKLEVAHTGY